MAAPIPGREKIESRLLSILADNDVDDSLMDKFGDNGITKLSTFSYLTTSREKLELLLDKAPFDLGGGSLADSLAKATVLAAWDAAKCLREVEVKKQSERIAANLPPELKEGDLEVATKLFEKTNYELSVYTTPSKAFFERLMGQCEGYFEPVNLKFVTNLDQQDKNQTTTYGIDVSGGLLRQTASKPFAIQMPKGPESLRARLRLLGVGWAFCKGKYPAKPQLRSVTVAEFDNLTEYLFGPKVWGLVHNDSSGNPVSSPTIDHVLCYLWAIFKRTADDLNNNVDFATALKAARDHSETKILHFINPFSTAVNTAECRACTAPGLHERMRPTEKEETPTSRPLQKATAQTGTSQNSATTATLSKSKKARLKKAQKQQDLLKAIKGEHKPGGAAKKVLALGNGGDRDQQKGAGKGKRQGKLKDKTASGKTICFNWSKGKDCHTNPCPHEHCCRICEGKHRTPPMGQPCPQ